MLTEYQKEVHYMNGRFNEPDAVVLSLRSNGLTVEVSFDRIVFNRPEYFWRIFGPEGPIEEPILHGGPDGKVIKGGSDSAVNLADAMRTLATFLGAWQEASSPQSENWDLFDNDMRALDYEELLMDIDLAVGRSE